MGIYALYEQVTGRVQCLGGLSAPIASKVATGVTRVDIPGTPVHIMFYTDDIILFFESQEGLQQHLQEF